MAHAEITGIAIADVCEAKAIHPARRERTMTLLVLAYLGGVLTIISPCILPVLPFVFARADRPFAKSGLPMLVGMAVTFAAIATLAVVAGAWAEQSR